jgi:hypothetical protein
LSDQDGKIARAVLAVSFTAAAALLILVVAWLTVAVVQEQLGDAHSYGRVPSNLPSNPAQPQ